MHACHLFDSGGERSRWEQSIAQYEEQLKNLIGDCAVAAAFRSYAGPFPANYRKELVASHWLATVRALNIPCTPDFSFAYFLASPSDVMSWSLEGLYFHILDITCTQLKFPCIIESRSAR